MDHSQQRRIRLTAVACALLAFLLGLKDNGFPFYYHIDEPGKVAQLASGERNFNHPLLLLTATDLAVRLTGRTPAEIGPMATVRVGRSISALFSALAVGIFALLAGSYGGTVAAGCVGVLGALHFDLFEKAHYLKEDPALVLGFAATFLALENFTKEPGNRSALFLGLAAGLAASGKYIGAICILITLPFVLRERTWESVVFFVVGAAAIFLIINYPLFTSAGRAQFAESLAGETAKVAGGTWQQRSGINFGYFERILQVSRAHIIPFLIVGIFALCRRRSGAAGWILALFPFVLATLLAVSLKTSGRYFLPGVLAIVFVSGVGLATVIRQSKPWLAILCVLLALVGSLERLYRYESGFRNDPRRELTEYIRENVPAGAVVLQGASVHLPDPEEENHVAAPVAAWLPQRIITSKQPAGYIGDDATYVAVTGRSYERYTKSKEKPKGGYTETFARNQAFYRSLFEDNPPVWEREAGRVGTHNPAIRLYRVPGVE